jgi:hypothetical protein
MASHRSHIQQDATNTSNNMPSSNTKKRGPDLSYSILWTPLWPITLVLPFIGHTGIADSHGVCNDFQGSYYVGTQGQMAFGNPTRYLKIDVGDLPGGPERWDEALQEANRVYSNRVHNICCDNCHSHVCFALNRMDLKTYGITQWDMVKLCFLIFFRANFVSVGGFLCQFLPSAILVAVLLLVTK